jgi:hypothetical protein
MADLEMLRFEERARVSIVMQKNAGMQCILHSLTGFESITSNALPLEYSTFNEESRWLLPIMKWIPHRMNKFIKV